MSSHDFGRLRELWAAREHATQAQWHELFVLVDRVLRRARMLDDRLERSDLVQGYFCDRVLAGRGLSVPDNEAALLNWFRKYQLDQIAALHQPALPWSDGPCGCEESVQHPAQPEEVLFRERRKRAVAEFFDALSQEERLLLQLSHCDGESVLSVQQQHGVRSAHYRSKQLGILLGRSTLPVHWARSKLGRLVKDLGLTVERTMGDDLLQVFRLLCERSQQWWKQAQA